MDVDPAQQDGRPERESGPRAWVVLAMTLAVAGLLVGGGLFLAGRLGTDSADEGAPATVAPLGTAAAAPASANRRFERTAESGITLRVYSTDEIQDFGMGFEADDLPAKCRAAGMVQATAIGAAAVTTTQSILTEEAPERGNVGFGVGGVIEGEPILALVLQTPPDVTAVGVSTAAGGIDSMTPVDGISALAVPAPEALAQMFSGLGGGVNGADPWSGVLVELRRADGSTTKLQGEQLQMGVGLWNDPDCVQQFEPEPGPTVTLPPPTLPEGTGELPPDPAAAEAEIRAAFDAAYTPGAAADRRRLEVIDDPSGIQFMIDRVRSDPNGIELDPTELEIGTIGFLTAVEASFLYEIELPDGRRDEYVFGRARFVDGAWKITRATVCNDWEKVFTNCGP
jgi:hypothetical protein